MTEYVTISDDYRNLKVPQNQLVLGCVGDAWVRRVHFTAPRYCDGTDLSGYDYTVQFVNEGGVSDVYVVDDATASTDTVTFTWPVSPIACAVVGNTEVSIVASNVDAQTGDVLNRFVTTTYQWQVLPSTEAVGGEAIEAETYVEAMIAAWQADIDAAIAASDRSYQTVADMVADTDLTAGKIVHTLGFHTAGDGGAAWYLISSTGTANGMDVIALDNGLFATLNKSGNIANILQYGADPTGTTDISAIFNYITSTKPVYIPIGTYLVSSKLEPSFSVIGESYSRQPNTQNATIIQSNISSGTLIDFDVNTDIQIKDFCIKCNGPEDGIHCEVTGASGKITINNIAVFNVSGTGITAVNSGSFASRGICISNIVIFGNSNYPNSRGIYLDSYNGDNRIENIEIMGTKYGISFVSGIYYGGNIHVWNGCLAGEDNGSWWSATRAIDLLYGARINLSNLYIDTSHMIFYNNHAVGYDNTFVNVDNFIYWEDNSNNNVTTADGVLLYSNGGSPTIVLNKALFYSNENSKNKNFYNWSVKIVNLEIISTLPFTSDNLNALFAGDGLNSPKYFISGNTSSSSSTYVEIARIRLGDISGFCKLLVSNTVGDKITELQFIYKHSSNTITWTKNAITGNENFYYKIENGVLHLYFSWGAVNSTQYRTVETIANSCGIVPFDYSLSARQNIKYDVLTSSSGLTNIQ